MIRAIILGLLASLFTVTAGFAGTIDFSHTSALGGARSNGVSAANTWNIVESSSDQASIELNLQGSSFEFPAQGLSYFYSVPCGGDFRCYVPSGGTYWSTSETSAGVVQPYAKDPQTGNVTAYVGWVAWAEPDSDLYNAVFLVPSGNSGSTSFYVVSDVSIDVLNNPTPKGANYDPSCWVIAASSLTKSYVSCPILGNGQTFNMPLDVNYGTPASLAITFTDLGDTASPTPEPGGIVLFTAGLIALAGLRFGRPTGRLRSRVSGVGRRVRR